MKELITKRIERLRKLLCVLFSSVVVAIFVEPLLTRKITETRPIPIWYPFEWERKLYLSLTLYLYEIAVTISLLIIIVSIDTFVGSVLLIIGGQLESLGYRLKSLSTDNGSIWRMQFKNCAEDYYQIYQYVSLNLIKRLIDNLSSF